MGLLEDGSIKTEIGQGSMEETISVLTPGILDLEVQSQ